jgi:hypothetical protein
MFDFGLWNGIAFNLLFRVLLCCGDNEFSVKLANWEILGDTVGKVLAKMVKLIMSEGGLTL